MQNSESILGHFFKYDTLEIPVYQRNYDWKKDNCKQLFNDIVANARHLDSNRKHFFGSIIYMIDQNTGRFSIIDGQQRIMTTALLLSAIRDMIDTGDIHPNDEKLSAKIDRRLVDQDDRKVFLRPVKKDRDSYDSIVLHKPDDYDQSSNPFINYNYFRDELRKLPKDISIDAFYESINRLQVMVIRLNNQEDDAQAVFESINSTGLDLTEGDKIRNFLLMNLDTKTQERLYDDYWAKIENNADDVSRFFRDYLTAVDENIPNLNRIYQSFKDHSMKLLNDGMQIEDLFKILLNYSKIYNDLKKHDLDFISRKASKTMYRINYMESTVLYPFLMRILDSYNDKRISAKGVEDVLGVLENYILRRSICGRPTNALNKIFQSMYRSLVKLNIKEEPADKLKYIIRGKEGSSSYPDDMEVFERLSHMDIYNNHKLCPLVLSVLEEGNHKDAGDILVRIDCPGLSDRLTIEHIMPQKKTDAWRKEIGENYDDVHSEWLHRLGNLTLTAYNSEYGCRSFSDKMNMEPEGLKYSPLNLNQSLKNLDSWTLEAIEKRNEMLVDEFIKLMPELKTNYHPKCESEKKIEEYTLEEGQDFFAYFDIKGYSLFGVEHRCRNGVDAFISLMKELYEYNPSKLMEAEKDKTKGSLGLWLHTGLGSEDSNYRRIGPDLYIYKNIDHKTKVSLLLRAADILEIDHSDIAFIGYR